MYTGGDICTETKRLRNVEVRVKCQTEVEDVENPSAISMYLIEPKKCSYILLVESSLMCDKLQSADEYGLLPELLESNEEEKKKP
jgi:endoplasmic reticulum lectin 1